MKPDERAHHLSTQQAVVAACPKIWTAVQQEADHGLRNVFFASAGGVALLSHPAAALLRTRSGLPVHVERAAELVACGNANLGTGSLAVFCSVSGTTPEAIAAAKLARASGARVLCLTGTANTPLAELADLNFTTPVADDTSSECFMIQTLVVALALLANRGEPSRAGELLAELNQLPQALVAAKEQFEASAARLAEQLVGRSGPIMFTAAGPTWPEAWYFAMCILEEMQWIWTRPIHASDFFHGSLELVVPGVPVVLLVGEGPSRQLADRVAAFVPRVGGDLYVIDSREFLLTGVSAELRELLAPVVLASVLQRLAVAIEARTGHPLSTRRYYRRMTY